MTEVRECENQRIVYGGREDVKFLEAKKQVGLSERA